MVYQQCGSLCLQTCTNNITSDCHGGCAEGCFCPDGLVLSNGRCVDPIVCPGNFSRVIVATRVLVRYFISFKVIMYC